MPQTESIFENIKHISEDGSEFWYARELQTALEYSEWRNFKKVIEKAKISCENSANDVKSNFVEVNKKVRVGAGNREIDDVKLSRYACYLVVQNGDPQKEVIALGQTYFAVRTRQQELAENFQELTENQKRLAIRNEITEHNKSLAEAAKNAGVETEKDYAFRIRAIRDFTAVWVQRKYMSEKG